MCKVEVFGLAVENEKINRKAAHMAGGEKLKKHGCATTTIHSKCCTSRGGAESRIWKTRYANGETSATVQTGAASLHQK